LTGSFVKLDGLRRELSAFYSTIGRPSIAPELMIRMLLVGYCFGIRSERRLCEEVHLNLAYLSHGCIDIEAAKIGSEVIVKWGDHGGPIKNIRAVVERFPYLTEGRNSDIDATVLPVG
jgi:hypothetical protein